MKLCHCLVSFFCSVILVCGVYAADDSANQASNPNLITQTVYGFLDFTTTIGNTVMVFSPQSSKVETLKPETTTPQVVIQTSPPKIVKSEIEIRPSKTETKIEKKASEQTKKVSTLVQVKSNSPHSTVADKLPKSSKVNVLSSIVNVESSAAPLVSSKVQVVQASSVKPEPSKSVITKVEVVVGSSKVTTPPVTSKIQVIGGIDDSLEDSKSSEPAVLVGNNINDPEYDFLSRQPSEVVEETYKVINLKPSSKFVLKPRPTAEAKNKAASKRANPAHVTGLVTKLGGTLVKDGTTTVHETSVIGTYISGKYAQILQSSSRILEGSPKNKISPSPSVRILKTAAPSISKHNKHRNLEPTPSGIQSEESAIIEDLAFAPQNNIKPSRKVSGQPFKLRYKNRSKEVEPETEIESKELSPPPSYKKSQRNRATSTQSSRSSKHKFRGNTRKSTTTPSVRSEETTTSSSFVPSKRFQTRRNKQHKANAPPADTTNNSGYNRKTYKSKVQPSSVEQVTSSTSLYKFKLNRSPGRWQYKTTPKPRVTIRKQNLDDDLKNVSASTTPSPYDAPLLNDVLGQGRQEDVDGLEGSESVASIIDDDGSTENKLDTPFPLETIKVEISTPPDFKDIYYEIATIKSPYTFQAGSVKNTRYITVTSTIEKSLVNTPDASISPTSTEPLTENILATSSNYVKDNNFLDSSIATLPPIYLASGMETPPLETLTETFSTTQTMLKTHLLPIVRNPNDTVTSTLVQTYYVTRLVTATKTLPPMEVYEFIPSKTLKDFNSQLDEAGSEHHLELEYGDQNENDDNHPQRVFPPDLDLANVGSDFNLPDVDKNRLQEMHLKVKKAQTTPRPALPAPVPTPGLSPEQLQQLAFLRLLNPNAAAPQAQVITTSKPIFKVETVYESHVIPVTNGAATTLTTLSKVVGTVTKTDYEFGTSTIAPALPIPPIPQIPQQVPVNPLFQQPQFAITTSPVVQSTFVTQTNSKILKLTFGAKTAYTTILSTTVVPTLLTTYLTASVQVQPTAAAFPGYFPAPYPPFPYVG